MRYIFLLAIATGFSLQVAAQQYDHMVGIRFGPSNGITYRNYMGGGAAIEIIAANRWRGFYFAALYEEHNKLGDEPGLQWFWGVGGHIGTWRGNHSPWFNDGGNYTVIGVDGIIGIDYTFSSYPVNMSLDYKPAFNLVGYSGYWPDEFALSIRYTW